MYCLIYRAQVRDGHAHEFVDCWTELLNGVQAEVSGNCYSHLEASDTRQGEYTVYTRWPSSACIKLEVFQQHLNDIKQLCIYFELLHESTVVHTDFMQHSDRSA